MSTKDACMICHILFIYFSTTSSYESFFSLLQNISNVVNYTLPKVFSIFTTNCFQYNLGYNMLIWMFTPTIKSRFAGKNVTNIAYFDDNSWDWIGVNCPIRAIFWGNPWDVNATVTEVIFFVEPLFKNCFIYLTTISLKYCISLTNALLITYIPYISNSNRAIVHA